MSRSITCRTMGWTNRSGSRASSTSTEASASAAVLAALMVWPASAAAWRTGTSSSQAGHGPRQRGGVGSEPTDANPKRAGDRVRGQRANALLELRSGELRFFAQGQQQLVQVERVTGCGVAAGLSQILVGRSAQHP